MPRGIMLVFRLVAVIKYLTGSSATQAEARSVCVSKSHLRVGRGARTPCGIQLARSQINVNINDELQCLF